MSLKAIEMQVALPRTHDAAKLQEQLQQRGQNITDFAADTTKKEADKKRTSVVRKGESEKTALTGDQEGRNPSTFVNERNRDGKDSSHKQERHPYKGNLVDYSG